MRGEATLRTLVLTTLLLQGTTELRPKFDKFDRMALTLAVETEVKASGRKESKYTLELDLSAEVEEVQGETAIFDCGASRLRVSGTLEGRAVRAEWKRGGVLTGDKVPGIEEALERGWKVALSGAKGFTVSDQAVALCDVLPILNPGVFLGLSVPLPFGPAEIAKPWIVKGLNFPYFRGFRLLYRSTLNFVDDGVAKLSSDLKFSNPETEVPIEGIVNVKGEGDASMDYDLKTGRPLRQATSIRLTQSQGGTKREVTQILEFTVNR